MRRVLAAALLLALPAPAPAAEGRGALHVRGAVELRWQGRPGACEEDGLCGVSGTVRWQPAGGGRVEYAGGPGSWRPTYLQPLNFSRPVVRVLRTSPDGSTSGCIDSLGTEQLFGDLLDLVPGEDGQLLLGVATPYGPGPFNAGRCAGPLPADVDPVLPATAFRRHGVMDLRARAPFAAGPFEGVVRSTLRAEAGPVRRVRSSSFSSGSSGPGAATGTSPTRLVAVVADYRVVSADGGFHATLAGERSPACEAADACGATGTLDVSPLGLAGRTLRLLGYRVVKTGAAYGPREALADLGAGRLRDLAGGLPDRGEPTRTTTASVRLGGESATCTDAAEGPLPGFSARGGRTVRFAIDSSSYGGIGDLVRTRCPGPSVSDVLGGGALLAGSLPAASLAGASTTVVLGAAGGFSAEGWSGERSGQLTVGLERTRIRVRPYG